jgi:UDP-galactopyranose mutase
VPVVTGPRIAVVGAGWAGAAAARRLHDAGVAVEVYEKAGVVGGHSRVEELEGVVYEPNGPHIFHTSDSGVAAFVHRFGLGRPYAHCPLTEIMIDGERRLFSWPLQFAELGALPQWRRIRSELDRRPAQPSQENFEAYCISLIGETLYRLFIYQYTVKQWDTDPRELAAHFAPKRIELRRDNDRRLFRDVWQYFPERGVNSIIEAVLAPVAVRLGAEIRLPDLREHLHRQFDGVVCTSPLDSFAAGRAKLAWRGIRSHAAFHPTDDPRGTVTEGYTINRPHAGVAFTRSVETKHASGQQVRGSIVCEEFPNGEDRHYPVLTADDRNRRANESLKRFIREQSPIPVWFCGRLANYQYINQDQAIRQGMDAAEDILTELGRARLPERGLRT